MEVAELTIDKSRARELVREYRAHKAAQTPEDAEIEKAYREIARGRVLIQALKSIVDAGFNEEGLPRLAIARADDPWVRCSVYQQAITFSGQLHRERRWNRSGDATERSRTRYHRIDLEQPVAYKVGIAQTPLVPVHLRPKHALSNYHILWEADWQKPPVDPYLLRRLTGDVWVVLAAWDLTPVERAAMANRLHA